MAKKIDEVLVIAAPTITGGGTIRGAGVVVTNKNGPHAAIDGLSIENYPTLVEWLTRINARCLWWHGDATRRLEGWTASGAVFVILIYANKRGFEIFTSSNTNDIGETFADAELRMGVAASEATQGLPYNPPVQPYGTRRELAEAGAAFVSVGAKGTLVSVATRVNQDDTAPTIFWFWTYENRAWCVGPYARRIDAIEALERFEALPAGPQLRVWGV